MSTFIRSLFAGLALCFSMGAVQAANTGTAVSTLEEVKERGTLRVGVRTETAIFGFIDEKGDHAGFDIDLAREIARRLDVELELVQVSSATRIPLLTSGRIDLIAATLTHFRDRDRVIDFSIAYLNSPMTVLVRKDSGIEKLDDLRGKTVGFNMGSAAMKVFESLDLGATSRTYEGLSEAFLALQQGLIDGMPTDIIILAGMRASIEDSDNYVLLDSKSHFGGGYYGLGLRENDSKWRDEINFILQDMWLDGTWDRIFNTWIGEDSALKLKKEDLDFEMRIW